MNVMLLAAGEGSRLRPYTLQRPKPAMPFLNVPLAAYPLAFLESLKVETLVVNTFHLPNKVVDLFHHLEHGAETLQFSHERTLLGNGGGLGHARRFFTNGGDFILMNSDEVILPLHEGQIAQAIAKHRASGSICTLLTMDHPGAGTEYGGVWLDAKNQVCGFGKQAPAGARKTAEHFLGVQILSEEIFAYLPTDTAANILYDGVVAAMANGKKVDRHKIECHWFETGNLKDFLSATKECLALLGPDSPSGYAKAYLKNAIERFTKEPLKIDSIPGLTLLRHSSAKIENLATLQGFAVLGANAVISPNCSLTNVVVAEGAIIAAGVHRQNEIFLGQASN